MATKQQEIKRLIREDYGWPVLQNLLAEMVYETRTLNDDDLERRYGVLLLALLGKPKNKIIKKGYKNDDVLLSRAASMTKCRLKKSHKTGKYEKRFFTISEASEEISRQEHIKGYKFETKLPKDLSDADLAQIRSTKIRLASKLKGKIDYYAKLSFKYGAEQDMEYEHAIQEIDFIKSLFPDWLERFGSYCRFGKK